MKKKRLLTAILAMAIMVSAVAIPASATDYVIETLRADMGGGATVSSKVSKKTLTRRSMFYNALAATSDGWSKKGDEYVYFRGRSSNGSTRVTDLARRNYSGTARSGNMKYASGYGYVGHKYKIAIEYDNNNPYDFVRLTVGWAS